MNLELPSTNYGRNVAVEVDPKLAYLAGLAYGDGYPQYGEIRIVTGNPHFRDSIEDLIKVLADEAHATYRISKKPGTISDKPQWEVALNSTVLRRSLFSEEMLPKYDSMHSIAVDEGLAPHFQAGLTDAEGCLLREVPVDSPHGRIFAVLNSDRRLLGIARLSLVYRLRLEPTSVRIRLGSKKGRSHRLKGIEISTRKNNYLIEILSGAKRKWLGKVGVLLRHPEKHAVAEQLLRTYHMS